MSRNRLPYRLFLPLLLGALLAGCEEDARPRSLVDVLKVLAVQLEPPEVYPSEVKEEPITARALVVDPVQPEGTLTYAYVACTSYTGAKGCLEELAFLDEEDINSGDVSLTEEEYRELILRFVDRGTVQTSGRVAIPEGTFIVPENYSVLLTELDYDRVDASLHLLICRPDACPMLDEIDAYLAQSPDALSGEAMVDILSQPELLTSGAVAEESFLARKNYRISLLSDRNRNHNPVVHASLDPECASTLALSPQQERTCKVTAAIESSSLEVYEPSSDATSLQESAVARFYTTAGELIPASGQFFVSAGLTVTSSLTLLEGQEASALGIYVIGLDSRGGMGWVELSAEATE